MSSNAVHAPIKLTKNDRTTYPWMNDLGIIFPCMSAIFCIDIPVVEFVEFDMATERLSATLQEPETDTSRMWWQTTLRKLLKKAFERQIGAEYEVLKGLTACPRVGT
jgi:hypothetical protein